MNVLGLISQLIIIKTLGLTIFTLFSLLYNGKYVLNPHCSYFFDRCFSDPICQWLNNHSTLVGQWFPKSFELEPISSHEGYNRILCTGLMVHQVLRKLESWHAFHWFSSSLSFVQLFEQSFQLLILLIIFYIYTVSDCENNTFEQVY